MNSSVIIDKEEDELEKSKQRHDRVIYFIKDQLPFQLNGAEGEELRQLIETRLLNTKINGQWRRLNGFNEHDLLYHISNDISLRSIEWHNVPWILSCDIGSYILINLLLNGNNYDDIQVLDLCTAPSTKAVLIADKFSKQSDSCSVVGVDINPDRLFVAKKRTELFKVDKIINLYLGDATKLKYSKTEIKSESCPSKWRFKDWHKHSILLKSKGYLYLPDVTNHIAIDDYKKMRRRNLSKKIRHEIDVSDCEATELESLDERIWRDEGLFQFNRVIVDAECTTDGSEKHAGKFKNSRHFANIVNYDEHVEDLHNLQCHLLFTGLEHLKVDESLVYDLNKSPRLLYSTCSRNKRQNQDVVERVLTILNK